MFLTDFNDNNQQKVVLALGYFDCLHIGHKRLVLTAKLMAEKAGALSGVFTFSNNPGNLLKKKNKLINTFEERLVILEKLGVDAVFFTEFTRDFMSISAEQFLQLLKEKNVVGVVCGFDYTFGKMSFGNVKMLKDFCEENDIMFSMVDMVGFDGEKASATLVKEFLIDGEMEKVNQCLGHRYFMTGKVCHGHGVGSKQVYPTANIKIAQDKLYPKLGVYAGEVNVDNSVYKCVINVGNRPTFDDDVDNIEVYIIDYKGDLYGKDITVYFSKYIREIKKFSDAQQLKEQISCDIEVAKCIK